MTSLPVLGPHDYEGGPKGPCTKIAGRAAMWGVLILALLGLISAVPMFGGLEVVDPQDGKVLFRVPLGEAEGFQICFIHSVNRRPVCDTLGLRGGQLLIVSSRFDSFGAGMPDGSTREGVLRRLPDGWLEWRIERPVPEVTLRVGHTAEHRLVLKGKELLLAQLVHPGQALSFRPGRVSLWGILRAGIWGEGETGLRQKAAAR